MEKKQSVYLDNNATTRVDNDVVQEMNNYYINDYAVASSQFSHSPGIKAKDGVDKARFIIAQKINAGVDEIIFTSGATESNNLAIRGLVLANQEKTRKKIIISQAEHFSVLNTAESLKENGYELEQVKVDSEGFVDFDHLQSVVDPNTLLVSIHFANHEVGTVQDIRRIADIVHRVGACFHTNAAVAFLQIPFDVKKSGIDLMSVSSHKVHGPKGVGALYFKKDLKLNKILQGGFQEFNFRPGTENVPGIVGFGRAVEIYNKDDVKQIRKLRDYLYDQMINNIDGVRLNGSADFNKRIPNNLNISFDYIEGESVVLHLDMRGIAVITGSACFSRALQASHILLAMGFSHERAHGSIRYSLSKYTTKQDIDYTVQQTKEVVEKLRQLSPLR